MLPSHACEVSLQIQLGMNGKNMAKLNTDKEIPADSSYALAQATARTPHPEPRTPNSELNPNT